MHFAGYFVILYQYVIDSGYGMEDVLVSTGSFTNIMDSHLSSFYVVLTEASNDSRGDEHHDSLCMSRVNLIMNL